MTLKASGEIPVFQMPITSLDISLKSLILKLLLQLTFIL